MIQNKYPTTPLSEKCITFFDFLRFILAQIVLIGHGIGFFFGYWDGFFPNQLPYPQQIAVVGFFAVSGFLICSSAMANFKYKGADPTRYFVERASRIYTTLIPALIFVYTTDVFFARMFPEAELLANLSLKNLLYNFLLIPSMPLGTMRPIWSLMFEWWIYILFGGLVFFRKRWILCSICIWLGANYTFGANAKGEAGHLELIWLTGALGAYYFNQITCQKCIVQTAWFTCIIAGAIYLLTRNSYNLLAGIFFSIGIISVAANLNADKSPPSLIKKKLYASLANFSFTLFLTHYTVLYWSHKLIEDKPLGFITSFLISNIIAALIAALTERHHKLVSQYILNALRKNPSSNTG